MTTKDGAEQTVRNIKRKTRKPYSAGEKVGIVPAGLCGVEKAAHLLYFVVKDHPFTDGNKPLGLLLFLLYLKQEGIDHGFNPQARTALTLLVAESEPAGKDLMIGLIVNLLARASAE